MSSEMAISLSNVAKTYEHFALSDINLQLEQGQIMGFIGPNGAGKSTTLRIIMGLIRADQGEISVLGKSIPDQQAEAKLDIGFASEDMRLYGAATLQWHMDFIKSIYSVWDDAYASQLVKRFGLRAEQKIKGLSHGQRVKAGLLLVLARRPRLLLLDEPTTGLDPVARYEVLDEMLDVLRDDERTILFSSHNTTDVEQLSDTITFIDGGRIIETRDKESFLDDWRRLRFEITESFQLPDIEGLASYKQIGNLGVATLRSYQAETVSALEQHGARMKSVDTMTLEEIFVANVMASRSGAEQ